MTRFVDWDQLVTGELHEQEETILGQIKDIVEPRDVNFYDCIYVEIEKQSTKRNTSVCGLTYIITPKYYSTSWLKASMPICRVKRKLQMDP